MRQNDALSIPRVRVYAARLDALQEAMTSRESNELREESDEQVCLRHPLARHSGDDGGASEVKQSWSSIQVRRPTPFVEAAETSLQMEISRSLFESYTCTVAMDMAAHHTEDVLQVRASSGRETPSLSLECRT